MKTSRKVNTELLKNQEVFANRTALLLLRITAFAQQASFYAEDGDEGELFASDKTNGRSAIAKLLDSAAKA